MAKHKQKTTGREKRQRRIPVDSCIRCGTCCMKGGPILHEEDKEILLARHIGYEHLVTIRKGELALNPVSDRLEPVRQELIKIAGKEDGWACFFYNEKKASCGIYENRPLECRLLKCWAPSELIAIIGKKTIVRADIINKSDPIISVIESHEQECPCGEVEDLILNLSEVKDKSKNLARLTELVRKDIAVRSYAVSELGLKKEFEPFIFGRPLHRIIGDRGLSISMR